MPMEQKNNKLEDLITLQIRDNLVIKCIRYWKSTKSNSKGLNSWAHSAEWILEKIIEVFY